MGFWANPMLALPPTVHGILRFIAVPCQAVPVGQQLLSLAPALFIASPHSAACLDDLSQA